MIPVLEKSRKGIFFFHHDDQFFSASRSIDLSFKNEKQKKFRVGFFAGELLFKTSSVLDLDGTDCDGGRLSAGHFNSHLFAQEICWDD